MSTALRPSSGVVMAMAEIAAIVTDGRYLSQQDLSRLRIKLKQLAATK